MHNNTFKPRVLFVDDYADFVDMLPLVFAKAPFEVIVAHGGHQALGLVNSPEFTRSSSDGTARPPFDLIVLDVAMPDMNGPTCAHRIASLCPTCEFVFLTGQAEHLSDEPGAAEVAWMNIPIWHKPIEVAELRAKICARLQTIIV